MTADGWIIWYFRTRDSFGAPALKYVDSIGRVYGKACAQCEGTRRETRSDGAYICANHRCGKLWPYEDCMILKGIVQKSARVIDFGTINARYFDVAALLHRFLRDEQWQWDAKLYTANTLGYSVRDLSVQFPAAFEDAPGAFSKSAVMRRIAAAREEWRRRLTVADISVGQY